MEMYVCSLIKQLKIDKTKTVYRVGSGVAGHGIELKILTEYGIWHKYQAVKILWSSAGAVQN